MEETKDRCDEERLKKTHSLSHGQDSDLDFLFQVQVWEKHYQAPVSITICSQRSMLCDG